MKVFMAVLHVVLNMRPIKTPCIFNLDDDFFSSAAGTVTMDVIYYDKTPGSTWELKYDAGAGNFKTAFAVTCAGTKSWLKRTIVLTDAEMLNNGPNGSDFALVNTDTLDDIFHLIELERGGTPQDPPGQSSNPNPPNEVTDVALNMVLSWTVGTGATEHGIIFRHRFIARPQRLYRDSIRQYI